MKRRLDQLLSSLGYCSRSEVRDWARSGAIEVSGKLVKDSGAKVEASEVRVDGEALDHPDGLILLLNKPTGLVCSHDGREGPAVYTLFPPRWLRRNPTLTSIGRLDKETSGLLLFTDIPGLVHKLTSPKHKVPKTYLATLERDYDDAELARMQKLCAAGTIMLEEDDKPCAPAELLRAGPKEARLILTEGRYHQVRRMFAAMGHHVCTLHRERFGELELGELKLGEWKHLPLDSFGTLD